MRLLIPFLGALGDETRWRLAQLVRKDALCVCELAEILDMPQSSVSSHLQVMRKAGLLDSERCEKWMYYRIAREHLPLIDAMSRHFEAEADATLARDARLAKKRLARRADTCCPGPKSPTAIVFGKPIHNPTEK